jgi:UDP-glucuronate 4-epimerase
MATLLSPNSILVTGAAGFIGHHVSRVLLARGFRVVGHDNLNPYYDPALKRARIKQLESAVGWSFETGDLADAASMSGLFDRHRPAVVVHLGAQAGVRWSLENPGAYVDSNLVGFANLLECCRRHAVKHLVYASSSSVYGANTKTPFRASDVVDHPISLYAATKKANELMAHCYSHLFSIPSTGLRFFTVYGPWGRPDMAYWKFTDAILSGRPLEVYGDGLLERDFTYVDDVVEAVIRVALEPSDADEAWSGSDPNPSTSSAPWRIYNIGNHTPVSVNEMIMILERLCGRSAKRVFLPKPPGDVDRTFADVEPLMARFGFRPATPLAEGLDRFVTWFRGWRSPPG